MKGDWIGAGVAFMLALALVVSAYAGTVWVIQAQHDKTAYEQCVASVPGYLDAEEITYQEQECREGVHP
ncbi:MAG: hypothetical protein RLZZ403_1747 [Pseudomonadota bacterium]|jgi:hypothetical protein